MRPASSRSSRSWLAVVWSTVDTRRYRTARFMAQPPSDGWSNAIELELLGNAQFCWCRTQQFRWGFLIRPEIRGAGGNELLDHLVGGGEHRRRHIDAERLRGLEIDCQLVLGGGLHRKVGRPFALEDAIDVGGRAPHDVQGVGSIADERPLGDELPEAEARRQAMA